MLNVDVNTVLSVKIPVWINLNSGVKTVLIDWFSHLCMLCKALGRFCIMLQPCDWLIFVMLLADWLDDYQSGGIIMVHKMRM